MCTSPMSVQRGVTQAVSKTRLFPNRTGSNRSCYFTVKPGELAMLCGFFPECAQCRVCILKVVRDHCSCVCFEKDHIQLGYQAGVTSEVCEGTIVMPGEYVAIFECDDPCVDLGHPSEWGIYVDVIPALENLNTLANVASAGAC